MLSRVKSGSISSSHEAARSANQFPTGGGPFVSLKGIGHKGSTTAKFKTYHFWSRKVVIIGLYGVVFHGEDACDVQRCVTLQNNMNNLKKLQEILTKSGRFFSGVETLNVGNRLKRALPKFEVRTVSVWVVEGR